MLTTAENALENLFKNNTDFLTACHRFGWGKIEITVKDGKPVMVAVKKEIKLS
jgi:hypothetical protein